MKKIIFIFSLVLLSACKNVATNYQGRFITNISTDAANNLTFERCTLVFSYNSWNGQSNVEQQNCTMNTIKLK